MEAISRRADMESLKRANDFFSDACPSSTNRERGFNQKRKKRIEKRIEKDKKIKPVYPKTAFQLSQSSPACIQQREIGIYIYIYTSIYNNNNNNNNNECSGT